MPGQRRAARRARARARLRFFLHRRGIQILDHLELFRIKQTLNLHHSKDPVFIRRITAEMASLKTPAWKCLDCRRMVKGNDVFCPGCGQHWEVCMDRNFQDGRPLTPTRHTTYRGQAQDSNNWEWQRRPSQSPRQRQRPRSRRQHGYGQDSQSQPNQKGSGKGRGKGRGKHHHGGGKAQPAPTSNAHGLGTEGMAPLPPPPLPPQARPGDTPWTQLAPPFPSAGGAPVEAPALSEAEIKLQKVLGILKKNQSELPPEVSEVVKDTNLKEGHNKIQNMHDAVENLGDAQQAFEKACFTRAQNLASWRQFLHLSVQRWQEYTQHFLTQERHNLDQITAARDAVKNAQSIFKDMQEKGVITIEAEDDPAMMEEEPSATKTESSRRIQEGLEHMTASLENLANQADKEHAEEQQQKKRPRKEAPATEETVAPSSASGLLGSQAMEPFGRAHSG